MAGKTVPRRLRLKIKKAPNKKQSGNQSMGCAPKPKKKKK
jgi:hypothetical protein